MQYLIFDIETVSDGKLIQKCIFPGESLSPRDAISKYRDQLLEQSNGKSDFVPSTFQLPISLALVAVDESFRITRIGSLDRGEFRPHKITQDFWQTWLGRQRPTMVTFNGRGFDLPILEHAAFRYGISIPEWFSQQGPSYTQSRNRYNTQSHFDIMDFLTNFGAMRFTGGLNLAATLLGKPGKMETKGSMVQDLWDQGKKLEIDDYCICDSLDTYFAFLRSKVLQGKLTLAQEAKVVEEAHAFIKEESLRFPILKKYLADFTFWQAPELLDSGFLP